MNDTLKKIYLVMCRTFQMPQPNKLWRKYTLPSSFNTMVNNHCVKNTSHCGRIWQILLMEHCCWISWSGSYCSSRAYASCLSTMDIRRTIRRYFWRSWQHLTFEAILEEPRTSYDDNYITREIFKLQYITRSQLQYPQHEGN